MKEFFEVNKIIIESLRNIFNTIFLKILQKSFHQFQGHIFAPLCIKYI